ncbi:MAG: hypothetical protein NVSMB56_11940 [Pyrinomonadaceae bacterium]
MKNLTHIDEAGRVAMVDTSGKQPTARRAIASAHVLMSRETISAVRAHRTPKGDPVETARIAGILAAKCTAELIPLCHPLALTHLDVRAEVRDDGIYLEAEVATSAQTGVEMEALTAVSIAALTIYDMCKAIDKAMVISDVRLEKKTGGESGDYERKAEGERQKDEKNSMFDWRFAIEIKSRSALRFRIANLKSNFFAPCRIISSYNVKTVENGF